MMMKVIGLAGRAGSGKSTVAQFLAQRPGIEWVDLDAVAWGTYAPGTDVYNRLVAAYGDDILGAAGEIDRPRLARIAFATPQARQTLDEIVHPAVSDAVRGLIDDYRSKGLDILLIEGALLASSPHVDRSVYDRILWIETPDEARSERLQAIGRSDHAARGCDVVPTGDYAAIHGEGSIEDVANRILAAIAGIHR